MRVDFSTVVNHHEQRVFSAVLEAAPRYPSVAADPDLLVDVACVALNRLPARYIRHVVDLVFYETESQRVDADQALAAAVEHAFGFVQARAAMRARA